MCQTLCGPFDSFIYIFISMYEILTMCWDLHELSHESTPKSCKVGVITPVLTNWVNGAQRVITCPMPLGLGVAEIQSNRDATFWRLNKYSDCIFEVTCFMCFCVALPFPSIFVLSLPLSYHLCKELVQEAHCLTVPHPFPPLCSNFCCFLPSAPTTICSGNSFPSTPPKDVFSLYFQLL